MPESQEPENFYLRWLTRTFSGPWGIAGLVGSILSLAVPALVRFVPDLRDAGPEMNDLAWGVPLSVFGALALVRVFIAPWSIFRDERKRALAAEARLKPAIQVVPGHASEWHPLVRADGTPLADTHRLVIATTGVGAASNVRVCLHELNGHPLPFAPLEMHPMHENNPKEKHPVVLQHETPWGFDLLEYGYGDTFTVTGREFRFDLELFLPIEMKLSVSADELATTWCWVKFSGAASRRLTLTHSAVRSMEPASIANLTQVPALVSADDHHEADVLHDSEISDVQRQLSKRKPRTVSESQKECLTQSLRPLTDAMLSRKITLQIMLSLGGEGWDSSDYAREFEDFLGSLGFKVSRLSLSGKHLGDDYRRGVWFCWSTEREKEYVLPFGQTFVDALIGCGIDITPHDHPDWAFYELVVGARRPE